MTVKDHVSVSRVSTVRDPAALEKSGVGYLAWKQDALAALFHNGEPMTFIAYLEFKNGVVRGNHWHHRQAQRMLVVDGELTGRFFLPGAPEDVLELTLTQGDVLQCDVGVVHSYKAPDRAAAIEYSAQPYEVDDIVPHDVSW